MEFLRFGSSIPGSYWGCCAVCIIQDFKQDPDKPYAIELVSGDGGEPINGKFIGKTYREVFETRIRIGTFNDRDMPNHAFLAVLTDWQIDGEIGRKWLKILKEHGFEFIRTVSNSVYTGSNLKGEPVPDDSFDDDEYYEDDDARPNYIFGLFRNIGNGAVNDPFRPPEAWTDLEGGVEEVWDYIEGDSKDLQQSRDEVHLAKWNETKTTFYKRKNLEAENIPIWLAGRRSPNPQELAKYREERQKNGSAAAAPAPFSVAF